MNAAGLEWGKSLKVYRILVDAWWNRRDIIADGAAVEFSQFIIILMLLSLFLKIIHASFTS